MGMEFWLTLLALFLGPTLGIVYGQWQEKRRELKSRRLLIFRNLVENRGQPIHATYVAAFNLIPVDFAGVEKVIDAWKKLRENLDNAPGKSHETHFQNRKKLQTDLLNKMANSLNINFNIDSLDTAYFPQGWQEEMINKEIINEFWLEIAKGTRSFPVSPPADIQK